MKSRGLEALNYLYNDLRLMKCLGVVEEVKVKSAYECLKQALLNAQELEKENQELIKKADCCLWKDCNKISQENQELKRKYESRDFLYQNEVSKNGTLAGKIFEKDLKIQKLEKAIEVIKNKGIDYHSISAIKQSKDYEDYLDLVKNLITVVFKLAKQEYEILKEVFCND